LKKILAQNLQARFTKFLVKIIILLVIIFPSPGNAVSISLISDAEVEQGVRHIINPIIRAAGLSPEEMNVYIVLNSEINAFAISGNNIFINTGLIMLFNDANVLKGVVAHELGHVTGGHIVRMQERIKELYSRSIITSLLGVAAIAGGVPNVGGAILSGSGHGLERGVLKFSRENEYSADQAGFKYLRASKNSSEGLIKILDYLNSHNTIDQKEYDAYLSTHPLTSERLFAIKNQGKWEYDTQRNRLDQQIYSRIYAKLHGFIDNPKLLIEKTDPTLDQFDRDYELSIAYFRLHNLNKALSLIDNLIQKEPEDGYLYELKAQFLFEYGKLESAIPVYEKAVDLHPENALIKLEYAVALINSANKQSNKKLRDEYYNRAIALLDIVTQIQPNNGWAYRNMAIAYGRIGEIGASNLMLAEEALAYGDYVKANMFISIAKRKGLNNNLQLKAEDIIKSIGEK
jgi:predicted Zn-dependent protease